MCSVGGGGVVSFVHCVECTVELYIFQKQHSFKNNEQLYGMRRQTYLSRTRRPHNQNTEFTHRVVDISVGVGGVLVWMAGYRISSLV